MKLRSIGTPPLRMAGLTALWSLACSAEPNLLTNSEPAPEDEASDAGIENELPEDDLPGEEVIVQVDAEQMTYVDLESASVVDGDVANSRDWDLAFRGWEVFTNSGPSGPGEAAGFGPAGELDYLFDGVPDVPFMRADETGGAFLGWYDYDGENHAVWSRYHVYGVRDESRLWKVQILSYYGEDFGAPVSAYYRFRYAEVNADGVGETLEVSNLDGTAGYPEVSETSESGCIDLASGEQQLLAPATSSESDAWHLCFRREAISVNGELGGPRGVGAVDLDGDAIVEEALEDVMERTPESELERFDDVDLDDLDDESLSYRGDRVVSIFADRWFEGTGEAAVPRPASWLIRDAEGERHFLIVFREIRGRRDAAGEVRFRVREVFE